MASPGKASHFRPCLPICGSGHSYFYFKNEDTEDQRSQVRSPRPRTRHVADRTGPSASSGTTRLPVQGQGSHGPSPTLPWFPACPHCRPHREYRGEGPGSPERQSTRPHRTSCDSPADRRAAWWLEFSFPLKSQVTPNSWRLILESVHTMMPIREELDRPPAALRAGAAPGAALPAHSSRWRSRQLP